MLGMTAADRALNGISGQMAVVVRKQNQPYRVSYGTADIGLVANYEKKVPDAWINQEGNDVTEEMMLVRGEVYPMTNSGIPVHLSLYSEGK